MNPIKINLHQQTCWLYADKAIYWQEQATLLIADIHFGKCAVFRAAKLPVPTGTTEHDLLRLIALLKQTQAKRVIFLGDFFHAIDAVQTEIVNMLLEWRRQFANVELILVRGNHDLHAGDPPKQLAITCVDEPYSIAPFVFTHHPQSSEQGFVFCGHIHPTVTIYGKRKQSLRLPCFYFKKDYAILPAYSSFSGGYDLSINEAEAIYLIADDEIVKFNQK